MGVAVAGSAFVGDAVSTAKTLDPGTPGGAPAGRSAPEAMAANATMIAIASAVRTRRRSASERARQGHAVGTRDLIRSEPVSFATPSHPLPGRR